MRRRAPAVDVERGFGFVRRLLIEIEAALHSAAASDDDVDERPGRSLVVQRHLTAVLHDLEAQAPPDPERRVAFALAAIADEWLLNRRPWPGQAEWPSMLLEEAIFGTRVAGERMFRFAEAAMGAPPGMDRTLAAVLLSGFLIGFEGRYRGAAADARLSYYREGLFRAVFERPLDPTADPLAALPTPRPAVAPDAPLRTLPALKPYAAAFILLVLGYFVGAHLIWSSGVRPILALAAEIVAIGSGAMPLAGSVR